MTTVDPDRSPHPGSPSPQQCGAELLAAANAASLELRPHLERDELLAALFAHELERGERLVVDGVVELLPEGFGFLRFPAHDFAAGAADIYLSPSQVRGLNLKNGHRVRGPIRGPKGNERFFALLHVDTVNGADPGQARTRLAFAARTPVVATRPLALPPSTPLLHAIGQLAPWCRGQRALLRLPSAWPRASTLAELAQALTAADARLSVRLGLFDQRPEDLAAVQAALAGQPGIEVVSTTFAAAAERHVAAAELLLAQVQREVEGGLDVVLLLDSLTALVRQSQLAQPASGRFLAPGLDAAAVQLGKRVFASARACAEGGSLTVLASVLDDRGNDVDARIAAEFAHRGNSEVVVDPELFRLGVALALDVEATRTRPEDDGRAPAQRAAGAALRSELLALPPAARAARLQV